MFTFSFIWRQSGNSRTKMFSDLQSCSYSLIFQKDTWTHRKDSVRWWCNVACKWKLFWLDSGRNVHRGGKVLFISSLVTFADFCPWSLMDYSTFLAEVRVTGDQMKRNILIYLGLNFVGNIWDSVSTQPNIIYNKGQVIFLSLWCGNVTKYVLKTCFIGKCMTPLIQCIHLTISTIHHM